MALVPFTVTVPAASQDLEERLLQVGPYSLLLRQRPRASGNTARLDGAGSSRGQRPGYGDERADSAPQQQQQQPDLSNVGLVLWQSGFLLADLLLLRQPQALPAAAAAGSVSAGWAGVRVLELGCGGGTVGMFLAAAGAQVVLTDQAHILALTRENLALNFSSSRRQPAAPADQQHEAGPIAEPASPRPPSVVAAFAAAFSSTSSGGDAAAAHSPPDASAAGQVFAAGPLVVAYEWGEPLSLLHSRIAAAAAERCCQSAAAAAPALQELASSGFDVIVGADLLYDASGHALLLASLQELSTCSPHARVLLAWRCRGLGEEAFEAAAEAASWVVEAVPAGLLHPEFQEGSYRAVCMVRLP